MKMKKTKSVKMNVSKSKTLLEIPVDNKDVGLEFAVKPHCKMMVCMNEETGEIELVYGKGCPKGYVEQIAGKIAVAGIHFRPERESEKE